MPETPCTTLNVDLPTSQAKFFYKREPREVKASERARALLVSPANKNMSKQTNYGLKIPIGDSKECKRQAIEFD